MKRNGRHRWIIAGLLLLLSFGLAGVWYQRCAQLSAAYAAVTCASVTALGRFDVRYFPPFFDGPRIVSRYDLDMAREFDNFSSDNLLKWANSSSTDAHQYHAFFAARWSPTAEVIAEGRRIEPSNGLYDLRAAVAHFRAGLQLDTRRGGKPITARIIDREDFEQAILSIQTLIQKSSVKDYAVELRVKHLAKYPAPFLTEEYLRELSLLRSTIIPCIASFRELAEHLPPAIRILIEEGRLAEAELLLEAWKPIVLLCIGNDDITLIQLLAGSDIGHRLCRDFASIHADIGGDVKANYLLDISNNLDAIKATWVGSTTRANYTRTNNIIDGLSGARRPTADTEFAATQRYLLAHGSLLQNELLPIGVHPPVTSYDLAPGRWHERVIAEMLTWGMLLSLMALWLLFNAIIVFFLWMGKPRLANPPYLLPGRGVMLKGLLVSIVLPYLLYLLFTRSQLGGSEYGIPGRPLLIYLEMGVLLLTVLLVAILWYYKSARRASLNAQLDQPSKAERGVIGFFAPAIFALLTLLLLPLSTQFSAGILTAAFVILVLLIGVVALLIRKHTDFHISQIRYVSVGLVTSIVAVGLVIMPIHVIKERHYLGKDKVVYQFLANRLTASGALTQKDLDGKHQLSRWMLLAFEGITPEEILTSR